VPEKIRKETKFIFVERTEEVFKIALLDYDENQKSIEEILRKEIGKMVRVQKKKGGKKKVAKKR
ncbi:MAG: hypothetical protein KAW16_02290, partial [candidate division Zixibacteria bacterium]|nr:hypothetical protein [candidate division Zixibacteria bacterium]